MVLGDDLINNLMMDIHDLLYRCLLCTKGCYSPSTMIVLFPSVGHVFTFFFQLPVWMAIAEDSPKNYRKWCFGIPESDELIGGSDLVWAMSDLLFQRSRTKESRFFKLSRSLKGRLVAEIEKGRIWNFNWSHFSHLLFTFLRNFSNL